MLAPPDAPPRRYLWTDRAKPEQRDQDAGALLALVLAGRDVDPGYVQVVNIVSVALTQAD